MPQRANYSGNDYAPQVFNLNNRPGSAATKVISGEKAATIALQTGGQLSISKKLTAGNANHAGPGANAKKMDEDHETLKHKTLDSAVRLEIQRQRQAKQWSQGDLAQKINERESVVKDYEQGKVVPSEQVLVKMEKAFGVHLRGALAGQPMEPKKPKSASAPAPAGKAAPAPAPKK